MEKVLKAENINCVLVEEEDKWIKMKSRWARHKF
jgi:hypothetical protein